MELILWQTKMKYKALFRKISNIPTQYKSWQFKQYNKFLYRFPIFGQVLGILWVNIHNSNINKLTHHIIYLTHYKFIYLCPALTSFRNITSIRSNRCGPVKLFKNILIVRKYESVFFISNYIVFFYLSVLFITQLSSENLCIE